MKETVHSSFLLSSLPRCIEKHLTPTSIVYFVIITEKSTKSTKNANDF